MKKLIVVSLFVLCLFGITSATTMSGVSMVGCKIGAFSPTSIAGLVLWLKSDTAITKDGENKVSVWADQSGSGNDATQVTGGYQPIWTDAQINGYPTLNFDGSDDRLNCHNLATYFSGEDKPYTIFVALKHQITTGGDEQTILFVGSSGSYPHPMWQILRIDSSGDPMDVKWDDALGTAAPWHQAANLVNNTNYILTSGTTDGGTKLSFYINGQLNDSGDSLNVGQTTLNQAYIGAINTLAIFDFTLHSQLAEIILYNVELSGTNRLLVENYLNGKYGIY